MTAFLAVRRDRPVQIEFAVVEKKPIGSIEEKRALIEPEHSTISIARQCELLELARSSYYYQPMDVA